MSTKPTMRDVAAEAGVSTMTVSRVLTRPERVAEPTRRKVQYVIDRLGYVPDRNAGSLSSQRTGFVAAIMPSLRNSNFADTGRGLANTLRTAGYQPLFGFTDYRVAEEQALVAAMLARRPEAFVLTGGYHTGATYRMLEQAAVPVVEIWDLPANPIGHAVGFSNFDTGRAMAAHLIAQGRRGIARLSRQAHDGFRDVRGDMRMAGASEALRAAGLRDDLTVTGGAGPVTFGHGAACIAALADDGLLRGGRVDAVIAVSDLSAVGALTECQRRGIRVPDDLAIAGFGDFEIGALSVPPISTVRVPCEEIGALTGRMLIDLLAGTGPAERQVHDLGFEVIARRSTGATGG
ncbi:MAG: LacI family DNA-binding transcriptional regulator [Alphaproteobacteria bacterium]